MRDMLQGDSPNDTDDRKGQNTDLPTDRRRTYRVRKKSVIEMPRIYKKKNRRQQMNRNSSCETEYVCLSLPGFRAWVSMCVRLSECLYVGQTHGSWKYPLQKYILKNVGKRRSVSHSLVISLSLSLSLSLSSFSYFCCNFMCLHLKIKGRCGAKS